MNDPQLQTRIIRTPLPSPIQTIHITYGTLLDPHNTVNMVQVYIVEILDAHQNVLFYWRKLTALVLTGDQRRDMLAYNQGNDGGR